MGTRFMLKDPTVVLDKLVRNWKPYFLGVFPKKSLDITI